MTVAEVRKKYLDFFAKNGHVVIPSASLVPENDPTTLFTGSGMQPLLPYLLGEKHPEGRRLVNSQKCFRAEDIEEVGDNRHTTFFEMLGNWSLGDYFKKEQLNWFFAFLTEEVGLDPKRLYVTVFAGDEKSAIPRDDEAVGIWKELFKQKGIEAKDVELLTEERGGEVGMQNGRIFYYGAKKNWWSRAGVPENMPPGEPGGPDSEVFFDFDPSGKSHDKKFGEHCHPNCDCGRFVEIGNSVFMQYVKREDTSTELSAGGGFDELPQKNVDFGGGLERITAAANANSDVFKIDTLWALIQQIEKETGKKYEGNLTAFRIIADHIRGAVFMIGDGVSPSNTEQGYFVRRLLRRAILQLHKLKPNFATGFLGEIIIDLYKSQYPNLGNQKSRIDQVITDEESKFIITLATGLRELEKLFGVGRVTKIEEGKDVTDYPAINEVDPGKAFLIYQTYGFPLELIQEELARRGLYVDEAKFREEFKKHQETSRAGSEQKFKGGLADHSDMSVKYHTATHLLHQALRDVLGEHVYQKGSNITPERLRFDFVHGEKMTDEQKKAVEDIVNEKIDEALPVDFEMLPIEEAKRRGAIGLFGDQYGDTVKVYKIGSEDATTRENGLYSFEFCGGPHVSNTSTLGEGGKRFKITKEEATSAGVRRIRAVLR